jgi:hypothetical protein
MSTYRSGASRECPKEYLSGFPESQTARFR